MNKLPLGDFSIPPHEEPQQIHLKTLRTCMCWPGHQMQATTRVPSFVTSVVWHPAQIYTLMSVVTDVPVRAETLLFYIRMASCNQIFDPWIYIMFQVSRLRRVKCKVKLLLTVTQLPHSNRSPPSPRSATSACPTRLICASATTQSLDASNSLPISFWCHWTCPFIAASASWCISFLL